MSGNVKLRIRNNASPKEKMCIKLVAETLKKLVQFYQCNSLEDCFISDECVALRYKLKKCLEKLILMDPIEFGQKAEDTIWKSIYYEPIRLFKLKMKSNSNFVQKYSTLTALCKRHITCGLGFYQKFLFQLLNHYNLTEVVKNPQFINIFSKNAMKLSWSNNSKSETYSQEIINWAEDAVARCLLYIGDLYRYTSELQLAGSNSSSLKCTAESQLPRVYYQTCLALNNNQGRAYNQLGVLATHLNYGLDATQYFLRAHLLNIGCCHDKTTSATETSTWALPRSHDNLSLIFSKNTKRLRSILDKEIVLNKLNNRHKFRRQNIKVFKVKSMLVKYLNLSNSFYSSLTEPTTHQYFKISAMCDEILNCFRVVVGFDRRLTIINQSTKLTNSISTSGANNNRIPLSTTTTITSNTKRPNFIGPKEISHIMFIGIACIHVISDNYTNGPMRENPEVENPNMNILLHICHSFVLNLFGHIFNQCLIRIRDEMRNYGIDVGLLFRRHDNANSLDNQEDVVEEVEEIEYEQKEYKQLEESNVTEEGEVQSQEIRRKKKASLSRRLVRPLEECLSEYESEYEDEDGIYDVDEDDEDDDGIGLNKPREAFDESDDEASDFNDDFIFSDSDDNGEFNRRGNKDKSLSTHKSNDQTPVGQSEDHLEEEDEFHSQDEDDQIIRAIVGPGTVFGRQSSFNKDQQKTDPVDLFCESSEVYQLDLQKYSSSKKSKSKHYTNKSQDLEEESYHTHQTSNKVLLPDTVLQCLARVELLPVIIANIRKYLQAVDSDPLSRQSLEKVKTSAPYLWKHLTVCLNFCENVLDDFCAHTSINLSSEACTHLQLPHHPSLSSGTTPHPTNQLRVQLRKNILNSDISCDNVLHRVIHQLLMLIECGQDFARSHTIQIREEPMTRDIQWQFIPPPSPVIIPANYQYPRYLSEASPRSHLVSRFLREYIHLNNTYIAEQKSGASMSVANKPEVMSKLMRDMAVLRLENILDKSGALNTSGSTNNNVPADATNQETAIKSDVSSTNSATIMASTSTATNSSNIIYFVPDIDFLIACAANKFSNNTSRQTLHRLVKSERSLVVVVPPVLDQLDRCKSSDISARKAILFLEELHKDRKNHIKIESNQNYKVNSADHYNCNQIQNWNCIEVSVLELVNKITKSINFIKTKEPMVTLLTLVADELPQSMIDHYLNFGVVFKSSLDV